MKTFYLVTGAAGYLGGEVCRQIVSRGLQGRALVLPGVETVVLHCASRGIAECFGGNGTERTAGCAGQPVTEAARKAPLTGAFVLPACG